MIRLTIDGQEITVPAGTMIVDAAAKLGIDVPIYCYHQALGPLGACRMCLVQVEKMPKLATGCTTAVAEGMVVHTKGPAVEKGRKGVLEFLLINHPLDCPVCDKGGECYLQDYTFQYGPEGGRFEEPKIQKRKDYPINDLVLIDQERCVLCQRCVRFMGEYVGEEQLLLEGRGVKTVVTTVDNEPARSQFTGNVIDLCPVGALLSKPYLHKARPWNIEKEESVCPHCPVGCTTLVTGRDGHVMRVEGRPVPEREWGWLCDRGRFGYDFGYYSTRLMKSLLDGREVSAAEATREVAHRLEKTVQTHGPDSVAFIIGGTHTTEEAYELNHFAREIVGTSQLAVSRSVRGYLPRALNGNFGDIQEADTIVYLGVDPYEAVPVVHLKVRERLLRNPALKVIGLGPRKLTHETVPGQDIVVAPGEDAVTLALALAQAAPDHSDVQTLTSHLKGFYPEGLDQKALAELGQALLDSNHLVLLWDGQTPEMADVLVALQAVRTGATRVLPTFFPSNWRGYERAGISAQFSELRDIVEKARSGQIKMLFLWGADLIREYPDGEAAKEALGNVEQVVAEALVPPTGAEAVDVILPGAGWAEVYGTYVNMEARLQVGSASVPAPGQARPTKSYLTAWARAFRKNLGLDENWDPYDNDSGDFLPMEAMPESVNPLSVPEKVTGEVLLITGHWVSEGGLPSENLEPRRMQFPCLISVDNAEQWGIEGGGELVLSRGEKSLAVKARPDARIPAGRIYLPYGIPEMPVNAIGTGPVEVTRREEVKAL